MDELRGPTIQIVLHVREGLGFGFLKNPFIVSGSLNGYILETDSTVPCHAPMFDAELVWEADKRRFRNLRVQNVPIKVEVFNTSSQGRKDKVGYVLLSLLSAQPCPTNKVVNVKNNWHRLLGVKSEGKCCHPQLLLSLTVEDRVSTLTPRNELRMFHSNEVAYLSANPDANTPTLQPTLNTHGDFIKESQKTVLTPELQPRLICEEGLIQIGNNCKHLFILSFVIGSAENVDLLLPDQDKAAKETSDCYVTYSVFTHNIMTDRVPTTVCEGTRSAAHFNQRTSLRLYTDLGYLTKYFAECPYVIANLCSGEADIGVCSMDLRKLIPTEHIENFVKTFCNNDKALTINERCYILCTDERNARRDDRRKPFIDIEMSLKYVGVKHTNDHPKPILSTRSASQLPTADGDGGPAMEKDVVIDFKSGSCAHLDQDVGGVAYTNITARNTNRYKTAVGDAALQGAEIADMIRNMCESFTHSQERLLAARPRPATSDAHVQCQPDPTPEDRDNIDLPSKSNEQLPTNNDREKMKLLLSSSDRDAIMQKYVEELEDWKERQQDLYKCQLERKEEYHLDLLAREWGKRRAELEGRLSKGIEQCRNLAADLSRATDDFRLRGFRNTEREKKLSEATKALEQHYSAKYQELRMASQKMEDDMQHRLKLKDMHIEELEAKVQHLENQIEVMKNSIRISEKDAETKYSGLTKDQTASLIQELRCLEEKLDNATQSKAFFKEQWGRAVRELHASRLRARRQVLLQLRQDRRSLGDMGLDTIEDQEEPSQGVNIKKLRDDFYMDILTNTPNALDAHSLTSDIGEGLDTNGDLKFSSKNSINEKLNELIKQRDSLISEDTVDEEKLTQLNQDIRNILLNYGT